MFLNGVLKKNIIVLSFLRQTALLELNPSKNVLIFMHIVSSATNTDILAPELVGDQSEMVVSHFFHKFFIIL